MSPSEFDLRAALHQGEGDGVDADRVIRQALAARQTRRERLVRTGSIAAVVTVVAGLGIAGAVVLHDGSAANSASGGGATAAAPAAGAAEAPHGSAGSARSAPSAASSAAVPVAPGPARDAALVSCPPIPPALDARRAGTGSLFSGPVEAIKVCAYATLVSPDAASRGVPNTTYFRPVATQIATSIDSAATVPPRVPCPMYRVAGGRTLVIIGVSPAGSAMAPITVQVDQNPCDQPITNGSAVRYDWVPPASMRAFLNSLAPASPPGGGTGSSSAGSGPGSGAVSLHPGPVLTPPRATGSPVR